MNEWNEAELTAEQVAKMSDEEIAAHLQKLEARLSALRDLEKRALEALEKKDPDLAAEMRKQIRR